MYHDIKIQRNIAVAERENCKGKSDLMSIQSGLALELSLNPLLSPE